MSRTMMFVAASGLLLWGAVPSATAHPLRTEIEHLCDPLEWPCACGDFYDIWVGSGQVIDPRYLPGGELFDPTDPYSWLHVVNEQGRVTISCQNQN